MEVVNALKRLGYLDRPAKGDHVSLFKLVGDHPEGPVTIRTGVDSGQCGKKDVARIQRQTKLKDEMWERALARSLPVDEYNAHLCAIPKAELVIPFWRSMFDGQAPKEAATAHPVDPPSPTPQRARGRNPKKKT
jgi:hypothetical protein